MRRRWTGGAVAFLSLALLAGTACSKAPDTASALTGSCTQPKTPVITLAAYSTVYDVYGKLISAFQDKWKTEHNGQQVIFQSSFGASTTQAANVAAGFPADVVALSLVPDVDTIQKAGLITHDYKTLDPDGGIVSTTAVVFDVRDGNPKNIKDWNDLTQSGLQMLTPDPSQSGGAKWNIVAAYGAAQRGKVTGTAANDPAGAEKLLEGIFKNVTVMDKSANDSLKNFQSGNGDVAITYENQVLLGAKGGKGDVEVLPSSTVLIQNPTVVVDKNAQNHCVLPVANAFVQFLHTPDAQTLFQTVGYFRPVDTTQAASANADLGQPAITDLFSTDDIGGWDALINDTVFGPNGAFTRALKAAQG
jgi:sulfate/thiosulfate transport system substrate-binding protein